MKLIGLKNLFTLSLVCFAMFTFVSCMYVIKSKKPFFDINIFTIYLTFVVVNGFFATFMIIIKMMIELH